MPTDRSRERGPLDSRLAHGYHRCLPCRSQKRRTATARRPVLVLVVDDNVAFAENVAEILELEGYATAVAASAEEALPRALAGDVRVLVTDYRLPGLTGAQLVALVRRQRGDVRAVVMSAFTDPGTVRAVRESDAHGFLPKPIDFSLLGRLIRGREGTA